MTGNWRDPVQLKLKLLFIMSFVVLPTISKASEIDAATKALNEHLREDGRGAVSQQEKCPKKGDVDYITDFKFKPIGGNSVVGSVYTMACPIGNGTDEYFVLIKNGRGSVIGREAIGVMNFMGDQYWVEGDILKVEGVKWVGDDAHCCPSKEGVLEYNLRSGRYKYNLRPIKEKN
jgi:hypothetical protein